METDRPPDASEDAHIAAAQWLARLHAPDCTDQDRSTFEDWRRGHPRRSIAYGEMERLFRRSAELRTDPAIAAASEAALMVIPRPRQALRWFAYIAVPAAAVIAVLWVRPSFHSQIPEKTYTTNVGEQQSLILGDGSTVLLDTDSSLTVQIGSGLRSVRLTKGRAQFQVVHNAKAPFTVAVAGGLIQDVGTEFQVQAEQDDVTVTVLEGAVVVHDPAVNGAPRHEAQLGPGQQLSFDERGDHWAQKNVDLRAAAGWTTGDLRFQDESLDTVLKAMNRYTHSQILLGDPSVRKLRISGVFHAGDQQSFVLTLERGWSVRSEKRASGDVILYAH
jgi:transmembrane sensor